MVVSSPRDSSSNVATLLHSRSGETQTRKQIGEMHGISPCFTADPPYRLIAILSCFMPLSAFIPFPRDSPDAVTIGLENDASPRSTSA